MAHPPGYTPSKVWAIQNGLTGSDTQAKRRTRNPSVKVEFPGHRWCSVCVRNALHGGFGIAHTPAEDHPPVTKQR